MDAFEGATHNSAGVVFLRVRLAKSFLEVGAIPPPHCRDRGRWPGVVVVYLGRVGEAAVSHQSALEVRLLWHLEDSGGAAIVEGYHKPPLVHNINAPTSIFWSRQNFVHPSLTLTAEIPVVSAENRRKVTAHSFFMLIEVTNAHSSLAGHHVSAVKVAGISCIIPPTRRVLEFTLVHTLHPHKRHGGQHMVHTLCGRGDPADAAQLCPMRMMQADAPGGHTLCLLGMIDQHEIGLLGRNSKRSPRPTRAKPPSPSMDPPWPALIANFWF